MVVGKGRLRSQVGQAQVQSQCWLDFVVLLSCQIGAIAKISEDSAGKTILVRPAVSPEGLLERRALPVLLYFNYKAVSYFGKKGDLPSRAQKLILEWATLYQQDLMQMWNTQEFRKLPPLK